MKIIIPLGCILVTLWAFLATATAIAHRDLTEAAMASSVYWEKEADKWEGLAKRATKVAVKAVTAAENCHATIKLRKGRGL